MIRHIGVQFLMLSSWGSSVRVHGVQLINEHERVNLAVCADLGHMSQLMPKIHFTRFPVTFLQATCWQQVVVMEFRKRHNTTDTTDFCPSQLVKDLLWGN